MYFYTRYNDLIIWKPKDKQVFKSYATYWLGDFEKLSNLAFIFFFYKMNIN